MYIFTPESIRLWWDHFVVFLYISVDLQQYPCSNLFQMLSPVSSLTVLFLADHKVSVEGSSLFSWTHRGKKTRAFLTSCHGTLKSWYVLFPPSFLFPRKRWPFSLLRSISYTPGSLLVHSWLTSCFSFQLLLNQFFLSLPWNSSPSLVSLNPINRVCLDFLLLQRNSLPQFCYEPSTHNFCFIFSW